MDSFSNVDKKCVQPYLVAASIIIVATLFVASITVIANDVNDDKDGSSQHHHHKHEPLRSVESFTILTTTMSMAYAHNAMLTVFADGTLIVAYQAAPAVEGEQDQRLLFHVSKDGGKSWRRRRTVIGDGSAPVWGPCLYLDDETLHLFYARAPGTHIIGGTLEIVSSSDRAISWSSPPRTLLDINYWNRSMKVANNQPIKLRSDGSFLLSFNSVPCMQSTFALPYGCIGSGGAQHIAAGVLKSTHANFSSFKEYGSISGVPTPFYEGTLAECSNGTVVQFFRSSEGVLYRSDSSDGGESWSLAVATDIPNPNTKVNLIARSDSGHIGELLLAYNPVSGRERTPLVVASSTDCGFHWKTIATLEDDTDSHFHYPTMVQQNKTIYTVYTVSDASKRQFFELKLAKFEL